jgi:hypothetical protein
MKRTVDVQVLKKLVLERLMANWEIQDQINALTGTILDAVETELGIDSVHFNDALHPDVHNTIMDGVEECIEFSLQAFNDEEWEES